MGPGHWLVQTHLARTLEAIAGGSPNAFYRGSIASALTASVRSESGLLCREDMRSYQAKWASPARASIGDSELFGPLHTGFPTMVEMLQLKRQHESSEADGEAMAWAWAWAQAFEDRFTLMSTSPDVDTPWERLMSADGAADTYASRPPNRRRGSPNTKRMHLTHDRRRPRRNDRLSHSDRARPVWITLP